MTRLLAALFAVVVMGLAPPALAQQRNASFLNPASAASRPAGDGTAGQLPVTVAADPAQIDAGETLVNVARRITVFFYNGFRSPVKVSNLTLNADGNVRSKVLADDCKMLQEIPVSDRCSIALEVIPNSPGPWTVELLLTHSGQGRIARAEIIGTTLGKANEKSEGLAISKKIAPPLEFGAVRAGEEQATRTMLIENDSNEPLLISSIDLIADDSQGLSLRGTGCKMDEQLKPGESCPITVIWSPRARGNIATDLIVRHNGNLGFVVVPIRGTSQLAEGEKEGEAPLRDLRGATFKSGSNAASLMPLPPIIPPPASALSGLPLPSAAGGSLPPLKLNAPHGAISGEGQPANIPIELIGTVGGRAILGGPQHEPVLIGLGETAQIYGLPVELLQLDAMRAVVSLQGVRKTLSLRNAPSYMPSGGMKNSSSSRRDEPAPAAPGTPPAVSAPETPATQASPAPTGASAAPSAVSPISPQQLAPLIN